MPLTRRVMNAYLFPNGNLAAFDLHGEQIPELQGSYSIEKHQRILLESFDACKFEGFEILPFGFMKHAKDFAEFLRKNDISWDERL